MEQPKFIFDFFFCDAAGIHHVLISGFHKPGEGRGDYYQAKIDDRRTIYLQLDEDFVWVERRKGMTELSQLIGEKIENFTE